MNTACTSLGALRPPLAASEQRKGAFSKFIAPALAVAVVAFTGSMCNSAYAVDYRIVLKTGDLAPETDEATILQVVAPSINASGRAVVDATFVPGVRLGLFTDATGPLIGAGVSGQAVPQLPSWIFDGSEVGAINDAGVVASFHLANNNRYLVARGGAVALQPIAFSGLAAPGLVGAVFQRPGNYPGMNSFGTVAFQSTVVGGGLPVNAQGIWVEGSNFFDLVAATGLPAHGASTANFVAFSNPQVSDADDVSFIASIDQQLGVASTSIGVWTRPAGGIPTPVMVPGDPVPNSTDFFDSARRFAQQGNGLTTFSAEVFGPQVTAANDSGIWRQTNLGLQMVAREGDLAPGGGGARFGEFNDDFAVSRSGKIGFGVHLTGLGVNATNDFAAFSERSGSLGLVYREGDPAPGVAGAVFAPWGTGFSVPKPDVNNVGDVAFGATISGSGITSANNQGIWFTHPSGTRLVVRKGQPIDLDPSPLVADIKIVSHLEFGNVIGTTGRFDRRGFNDAYDVGFFARFTDGTEAAIVADVFTGLPSIPIGDANLDFSVNRLDLAILALNYGQAVDSIFQDGDFNGDGDVSQIDLRLMGENWSDSAEDFQAAVAESGLTIPEPTAAALATMVWALALPRRRHSRRSGFAG